jgi:hypothetical protein
LGVSHIAFTVSFRCAAFNLLSAQRVCRHCDQSICPSETDEVKRSHAESAMEMLRANHSSPAAVRGDFA